MAKGVGEGNGIFLLGFPLGQVGPEENYVCIRGGDIARIRDCLDSKSDNFLINVPNFPGNSGGPIITKPEFVAIEGTNAHSSSSLIGVVSAYLTYRDVAISQKTGRPRVSFEENSGLAVAYPVDCIHETILGAKKVIKEPR